MAYGRSLRAECACYMEEDEDGNKGNKINKKTIHRGIFLFQLLLFLCIPPEEN